MTVYMGFKLLSIYVKYVISWYTKLGLKEE